MVKNLSRKSSTVFGAVSQDPLPPLPDQADFLLSGFRSQSTSNETRTTKREEIASMIELIRQHVVSADLEENRPTAQPRSASADRRRLEQEHQDKRRLLRAQQARLDAMLRDVKDQEIPIPPPMDRPLHRSNFDPSIYTEPFCEYLTENPTVFHAVDDVARQLKDFDFTKLSERDEWHLEAGRSYFVTRNDSSLIAFTVGADYKPGNGAAIIAGHVDALTAKLKPISNVPNKAGFTQLGVAPYAGALNSTWWDRDLGIAGRVLVRRGNSIQSELVTLDRPIARIPTLAPHFGAPSQGPFNPETQMVPIIGLESADKTEISIKPGTFAATQPPRLVRAIADRISLKKDEYHNIVNWELELYDYAPAETGGLDNEFIFAGRIDDKLCSWAAIQALLNSTDDSKQSGIIKVVGLFDDEEIGSLLRQGARGNFLPSTLDRAVAALSGSSKDTQPDLLGRTLANSFLVSSDVTHAVNPNFLNVYLENHAPKLNVGVAISADSNGHMTTDAVSTALFQECARKVGAETQVFQIRNDSRSGGTVGPMLSSALGCRAIDVGIPQLSMHSIRATTGSLDPGLGVLAFQAFLDNFEEVDKAFRG